MSYLINRLRPARAVMALIGLALLNGKAFGQSIEQALSNAAAADNIGKGFQTIAVLGQTPGTSSTRLQGDDVNVRTLRLHVQHRFTRRDESGTTIASPLVEVTLGRAKAAESILSGPGQTDPFQLDLRFRSRSILVGAGVSIPLSANARIAPMVIAGASLLRINGLYAGPNAATVNRFFDGLLNRAKIESSFVGPAVQADYSGMVLRGSRLTASARYNHIFNLSNKVTNPGLSPTGSVGVATALVRVEMPTRLYLGEREFFAGTFARGTILSGSGRRQFGFDHYGEIGGTLTLDYPVQRGLGVGLYGSVLRGPGVHGHSLGVTLRFAGLSSAGGD